MAAVTISRRREVMQKAGWKIDQNDEGKTVRQYNGITKYAYINIYMYEYTYMYTRVAHI